ncbi:MAG: transposase, partial [Planctomycetota bacterium]|nr:transposase [Planctomycetota bacterium]
VEIDGSLALAKAIRKRFGADAVIQRCQVHKKRNVLEHLPDSLKWQARMRMNAAYGMESYEEARKALLETVRWLRKHSEGAARSLEEGLEETLTLHRLGVPEVLRRVLSSTNMIESLFGNVRMLTRDVKRWRGGDMMRRWVGTMLLEGEKKFRRIRGHKYLPMLMESLRSWKSVARGAVGG